MLWKISVDCMMPKPALPNPRDEQGEAGERWHRAASAMAESMVGIAKHAVDIDVRAPRRP